jgi:hypothetical protein
LCEGGRSRDELVRELRARYPETKGIEREVDRFLSEMLALGGLIRVDEPREGSRQ